MLLFFGGEGMAFEMTPLPALPATVGRAFFPALSCHGCAYFGFALTKMPTHCVGLKIRSPLGARDVITFAQSEESCLWDLSLSPFPIEDGQRSIGISAASKQWAFLHHDHPSTVLELEHVIDFSSLYIPAVI